MAKFKVIVSDPETGTSSAIELEDNRATPFIGRKIGETMDGATVDLPAHKIQIKGGSDRDGVPMNPSVHGGVRKKIILSGGVGFKATRDGQRRRKAVRGNIITDEISQINTRIIEKPNKPKEAKAPEAKKEAGPEEKPQTTA